MNKDISKKITNRLHRIQGQIRGIEKMIDKNESFEKIITQMSAISSAVKSTKKILIHECIDEQYRIFDKYKKESDLDNLKSSIDRYVE